MHNDYPVYTDDQIMAMSIDVDSSDEFTFVRTIMKDEPEDEVEEDFFPPLRASQTHEKISDSDELIHSTTDQTHSTEGSPCELEPEESVDYMSLFTKEPSSDLDQESKLIDTLGSFKSLSVEAPATHEAHEPQFNDSNTTIESIDFTEVPGETLNVPTNEDVDQSPSHQSALGTSSVPNTDYISRDSLLSDIEIPEIVLKELRARNITKKYIVPNNAAAINNGCSKILLSDREGFKCDFKGVMEKLINIRKERNVKNAALQCPGSDKANVMSEIDEVEHYICATNLPNTLIRGEGLASRVLSKCHFEHSNESVENESNSNIVSGFSDQRAESVPDDSEHAGNGRSCPVIDFDAQTEQNSQKKGYNEIKGPSINCFQMLVRKMKDRLQNRIADKVIFKMSIQSIKKQKRLETFRMMRYYAPVNYKKNNFQFYLKRAGFDDQAIDDHISNLMVRASDNHKNDASVKCISQKHWRSHGPFTEASLASINRRIEAERGHAFWKKTGTRIAYECTFAPCCGANSIDTELFQISRPFGSEMSCHFEKAIRDHSYSISERYVPNGVDGQFTVIGRPLRTGCSKITVGGSLKTKLSTRQGKIDTVHTDSTTVTDTADISGGSAGGDIADGAASVNYARGDGSDASIRNASGVCGISTKKAPVSAARKPTRQPSKQMIVHDIPGCDGLALRLHKKVVDESTTKAHSGNSELTQSDRQEASFGFTSQNCKNVHCSTVSEDFTAPSTEFKTESLATEPSDALAPIAPAADAPETYVEISRNAPPSNTAVQPIERSVAALNPIMVGVDTDLTRMSETVNISKKCWHKIMTNRLKTMKADEVKLQELQEEKSKMAMLQMKAPMHYERLLLKRHFIAQGLNRKDICKKMTYFRYDKPTTTDIEWVSIKEYFKDWSDNSLSDQELDESVIYLQSPRKDGEKYVWELRSGAGNTNPGMFPYCSLELSQLLEKAQSNVSAKSSADKHPTLIEKTATSENDIQAIKNYLAEKKVSLNKTSGDSAGDGLVLRALEIMSKRDEIDHKLKRKQRLQQERNKEMLFYLRIYAPVNYRRRLLRLELAKQQFSEKEIDDHILSLRQVHFKTFKKIQIMDPSMVKVQGTPFNQRKTDESLLPDKFHNDERFHKALRKHGYFHYVDDLFRSMLKNLDYLFPHNKNE